MPNWTKEQYQGIVAEKGSLLVAAAAGSGKTAVLVERIINKVTRDNNPIDIDQLLVVTFTNAAATEMRERVGITLNKKIQGNSQDTFLRRQLMLLDRADISTIHSFCMETLRSGFHILGLDPDFRIADQSEIIIMKEKTGKTLLKTWYEDEDKADRLLQVSESYGTSKTDESILALINSIYEYIISSPFPEKWLTENSECFRMSKNLDFGETIWGKIILEDTQSKLKEWSKELRIKGELIRTSPGLEGYYTTVINESEMLKIASENLFLNWNESVEIMSNIHFATMPRAKKGADTELKDEIKSQRDEIKDTVNTIKSTIMNSTSEEIAEDLNYVMPFMKTISELVIEYKAIYMALKADKGVLDFSDLEHKCLELLIDKNTGKVTEKAIEIQSKYQEIMIDEYQDSNEVQELILTSISKNKENMFMVGDVKQSIYRFRHARPEIFLGKYNSYPKLPENTYEINRNAKLTLYKNFRSRPVVLDLVNTIFNKIMTTEIGEMNYTKEEELNLGAPYQEPPKGIKLATEKTEIVIIDKKEEDENFKYTRLETAEIEALTIGRRINDMIQNRERNHVYDKESNTYRPMQYRDIVIIMRSTSTWVDAFQDQLSAMGIPVFVDTNSGYFTSLEIRIIINLLRIIDNPLQDIPLLSVLRSPLGGFTDEEIMEIRLLMDNAYYYEAMKVSKSPKVINFLKTLDKWQKDSEYMPVGSLIWHIYEETGYYDLVGAMPGGITRQANLRLLFQKAEKFEESSYKGLFNFINFMEKIRKIQGDMNGARVLGENQDVVRIMTIHKSKGLEFPIVFLAGTAKGFNKKDLTSKLLIHHTLGYGPDIVKVDMGMYYKNPVKEALKLTMVRESLSEEMRILYVALTRAREKLIITGTVNGYEKEDKKWQSMSDMSGEISYLKIISNQSYLNWIMAANHSNLNDVMTVEVINRKAIESLLNEELKKTKERIEIIEKKQEQEITEEVIKEINRRLIWESPNKVLSEIPTKISVTEIKPGRFEEDATESYIEKELLEIPEFMKASSKIGAASIGNTIHLILRYLDLTKKVNTTEITALVKRLVDKNVMTQEDVNIEPILNLFQTPIGKRMIQSMKVSREIPFEIAIPCTEVYPNLPKDSKEEIIVQGIIDAYFEEEDGIVLLDYKTGRTKSPDKLKELYSSQMTWYKRAIEYLTGKKVMESYIVQLGEEPSVVMV